MVQLTILFIFSWHVSGPHYFIYSYIYICFSPSKLWGSWIIGQLITKMITKMIWKTHAVLKIMCKVFISKNKSEEVFSLSIFTVFFVSSSSKFRYAFFNIKHNYQFIVIMNLVNSVQMFISTETFNRTYMLDRDLSILH